MPASNMNKNHYLHLDCIAFGLVWFGLVVFFFSPLSRHNWNSYHSPSHSIDRFDWTKLALFPMLSFFIIIIIIIVIQYTYTASVLATRVATWNEYDIIQTFLSSKLCLCKCATTPHPIRIRFHRQSMKLKLTNQTFTRELNENSFNLVSRVVSTI